ncbi:MULTISPECIES: hypothetical protein [unclassified Nonomuraea]|nr:MULTISPECIES: hypothetical protein [unclassified Nonomuraea]
MVVAAASIHRKVVQSAERRLAGLVEQAPGALVVESEQGQVG